METTTIQSRQQWTSTDPIHSTFGFEPAPSRRIPAAGQVEGLPATLKDGSPVRLRPLGPDDADAIMELFEGLSDRSRYMRFASPTPRYTRRLVDHLCGADGRDHVAWGLYLGGRLIGVGRFVRWGHEPTAAEVAVTVADEHHGQGAGGLLLEALAAVAPEHGVERFTLTILGENRAMLRLLSARGGKVRYDGGVGEGAVPPSAFLRGRLPLAQRPAVAA